MNNTALKKLIGPFLLSLFLFVVLICLGNWQIARLHWKENLLAEIATAQANPPVPMPADPREFTKVVVWGRWDTGRRVWYGTDGRNDKLGAYLIEPLLRQGAPPLLIDRGFVPDGAPATRDPPGLVSVVGYIRAPDSVHWWSIKDDLAERHFYTLNADHIAAFLGLGAVPPYTLVVMGDQTSFPEPSHAFPDLPNNHLNYAITWYSLALVDLVIFLLSARKNLRT